MFHYSQKHHHRFKFYDSEAKIESTDIIEINTIELKKLPNNADGTALYDWAKFIAAETEEDLNMVAKRNPQVGKAVVKLRELSNDERARDMLERREKGQRDVIALTDKANKEGRIEGKIEGKTEGRIEEKIEITRKLLKINVQVEQIIAATGFTLEEVEALRKE